MTNYSRSAYGSNPNAGRPANGDRAAWGGYAWPNGVPSGLLATSTGKSLNGQNIRVLMRKELVPLWNLLWQIAVKHKYQIWANNNGEAWGPWGYSNRCVSGTSTPSGHSMALSVDMNAPYNPYSYTFQSDMPPAMVRDFEACGMYWGGRYTGKADAMHFGYCYPPSAVAGHIARARSILGAAAGATGAATAGDEDDDMPLNDADKKWIKDAIKDAVTDVIRNVNVTTIESYDKATGKAEASQASLAEAVHAAEIWAVRAHQKLK